MRTMTNERSRITMCAAVILLVSASAVFASGPDPDNAALFYYQAFLLYQQPDAATKDMLYELAQGNIGPNEKTRQYIKGCHEAIDYTLTASDMPNCNWGLRYSAGFLASFPHLAQTKFMSQLLLADARTLAADGAYRQAIERCMTVRKLARHVGDEAIISFLVAVSITESANKCTRDILPNIADDQETLTWLKNQLATVPDRPLSIRAALLKEQKIALGTMRIENAEGPLKAAIENMDPLLAGRISQMTEGFFEQSRDYYTQFMASLLTILDAPMSYAQAHAELLKLSEKPAKDAVQNVGAVLTSGVAPAIWKVYGHEIRSKTSLNALKAAVEIYLVRAKTGRLPEVLADGLPKDLFSGKDFAYEVSKDSFILRCQAVDLDKEQVHQYPFKVLQ